MRVVRRRVTVFGGILLAIIIILSIMLVVQNKAMIKQQLSVNIKRNSFRKSRDEEIALKEELSNLNNKDYIEKVARDDYYLSNKGEVIFKLPNNDDSKSKSSNDN